jgi:hypothetical protein
MFRNLGIVRLISVQFPYKTLQIKHHILIKILNLIRYKDLNHHFKDNRFINIKISRGMYPRDRLFLKKL